jgi:hypothetical protein
LRQYRAFLGEAWTGLAEVFRDTCRPDDAAFAARQRAALWPDDPDELCTLAGELALCAPLAGRPSAGQPDYAGEALEALGQAIRGGFRDAARLQTDPAFGPLRGRDEFRLLLMDLSMPADPFAR